MNKITLWEDFKQLDRNDYLTNQIITYIGNKRKLLDNIYSVINSIIPKLNKATEDIVALDLFAGSGIVGRLFKEYGFKVISNDLEKYSYIINSCYLSNKSEFNENIYNEYKKLLTNKLESDIVNGVITNNYSPKDDNNIQDGERVFYTHSNAQIIDTIRCFIDNVEEEYKKYFLAPLLYEASVHTNTSGIFKGFYKDSGTGKGKFGGNGEDALERIKGKIELKSPILSNKENDYWIHNEDANELVKKLSNIDIAYLDPPYDQHPYASNYFMLNLILNNELPNEISGVSGIPKDWNHSDYNKKDSVENALENLVKNLDSRYIIISYNSEGFISFEKMLTILKPYGNIESQEINYNTFRASRNLNSRDKYVKEYLFILEKNVDKL